MPETLTKLTEKERRFVLAYLGEAAGNGQKAAEMAGYAKGKGAAVTASRLLRKASVKATLANAHAKVALVGIADAAERREILSNILRSAGSNELARINAANVLNKMDGIYVQKHKVEVTRSLEDLVAGEARP